MHRPWGRAVSRRGVPRVAAFLALFFPVSFCEVSCFRSFMLNLIKIDATFAR